MKRFYLLVSLCLWLAFLAQAHEFWLQPGVFFTEPGQAVPLEVLVGENFNGERSEGKKNRLVQYVHWTKAGKEDLSPQLTEGHYGVVPLKITTPGTHLVGLANTNKYLAMRADSFLLYLQEDGLDNVIRLREERGQTKNRSRELYRRCVKTLIQAGPVVVTDQTFAMDMGMPLEIIPVKNPYQIKAGEWLEFKITCEHQPLTNALVRYWNLPATVVRKVPDAKLPGLSQEQQRTDSQGRVRFQLKTGQNMVSLVHMIPCTDTTQADWQSYWGSLTFGCR